MAFVTENGSGVKNANSYVTVSEFTAYLADRGITHTLTDAQVQALLVLATGYIDVRWKFRGTRQFANLTSRSVLTLTGNATDGESIVLGASTYVLRDTPTANNEIEIGANMVQTANNIAASTDSFMPDTDVPVVVLYMLEDGLATTTDMANGTFDSAVSQGSSAKQQSLEWPRDGVHDRDGNIVIGIPAVLKAACIEYAWRANTASLMPDPTTDATGGKVILKRQKVGPIETETQYSEGSTAQLIKPYPYADGLISMFATTAGVVRA